MKFFRIFISTVILFSFTKSVYAQAWLKDLEMDKKAGTTPASFYDVTRSFNSYWADRKIEKGKGWKQFRRWENFMEPRVYPDGNLYLANLWDLINPSLKSMQLNASDWISLGPVIVPDKFVEKTKSGMGRINCIAFHPDNEDILYAGSPSGGFWKTINGGASWHTTTDMLMSIGVSDIAINPADPDIIYIATGDGDAGDTYGVGILKSTDAGVTWNTTNLSVEQSEAVYNRRIVINPENPDVLLVASNLGIYRTEDGFSTYSLVKTGNFKDIEFKPGNASIVYASNYEPSGNARVYKSTDGGKVFNDFSSGLTTNLRVNRIELGVTPANPNYVYALCSSVANDGFYALYKSTDAGGKWVKVYDESKKNLLGYSTNGSDAGGQGWYDLALAISPVSVNEVYTGGVNIYKSINGGSVFSINAHWVGTVNIDYVHADQHMLAFNPLNNYVYSCNDGGVYVSKDNGSSWSDISNGLNILQIYKISASASDPDFYVTGNQDNGSFRLLNGVWEEINGGDGMECWIDPSNDSIIYTSLYYGSFYRSDNKGESFNYITPHNSGEGAWITPLVISESNPSHIYAGYLDIFMSHNRGDNWYKISHGLSGSKTFHSLAVSPLDENYIYAATYDSIWISKNGGRSWEKITEGLASQAITSITISPVNPLKVWITQSGYTENEKVYFSENGGLNWINFSDGIPNIPVNTMVYQKESNELLYAGTDLGVYFRDITMTSWEPYNKGLPNVIINDFDIRYKHGMLIAGSYGRGLWTSPLADATKKSLFAEIIVPSRYICVGDSILLSANTSLQYDSLVWNFPDGIISQTKIQNKPVPISFATAGYKKIRLSIYHSGDVFDSELNGYLEAISLPDINIVPYDTANFHNGSVAVFSVSGASDYAWDNSPYLSSLTSDLVTAKPDKSTVFYVTGSAGNCSARDSILLRVRPSPENDDVCSAIQLQTGRNGPYDNFYAGVQVNEPLPDTTNCNTQMSWCEKEGGLQASVWFKYTANSNVLSFSTEGFDTQIAIYSAGDCRDILSNNYTLLAANDDYYGDTQYYAAALKKINVVPGTDYFLQLDGSAGGMTGRFYVTVMDFPLGISNESGTGSNIKIYPNPAQGEISVSIAHPIPGLEYRLYNSHGKLLESKSLANDPVSHLESKIKLPGKGLFLIKISGDGIDFTEKIVNH